jgi:hypothetical protein
LAILRAFVVKPAPIHHEDAKNQGLFHQQRDLLHIVVLGYPEACRRSEEQTQARSYDDSGRMGFVVVDRASKQDSVENPSQPAKDFSTDGERFVTLRVFVVD